MTRLAEGRTTHLTADEIAREVLRQYDERPGEPSIRSIAGALNVTPNAIYHWYPSRADLTRAAINLVWEEVATATVERLVDPVRDVGDPLEFFVISAVTTRECFGRHPRLALHLSMVPTADRRLSGALAIIGRAFEQLGITGDEVGIAFYAYLTYLIGAILIDASRHREVEELGTKAQRFSSQAERPEDAPDIGADTSGSLDAVLGITPADRAADDALFVAGLRRLLGAFRPPA